MSSLRFSRRVGQLRAVMRITADAAVSGDAGSVISIPFTTSHDAVTTLSGTDAAMFDIIDSAVVMLDTTDVGTYSVRLHATSTETGLPANKALTFTVNAAAVLPALTLTSATSLTSYVMQLTFANDAAYARYQGAINGDYGAAGLFALDGTKQVTVATPGSDYDVQVRGVTAGDAAFGPWSNSVNVAMPPDPGEHIAPSPAVMADIYNQRISVNCHFNFNSPADSNWLPAHASGWLTPLKTSGFRGVRTAFINGGVGVQSTDYILDLYATSSPVPTKFFLLINPFISPTSTTLAADLAGTAAAPVVATTVNITLSGIQAINGQAGVADRIVLVKNQSTANQNGVYLMKTGAWVRHTSFDTWAELYDKAVMPNIGSQANQFWGTTIGPTGTLGTTAVSWARYTGVKKYNVPVMQALVNLIGTTIGPEKVLAISGPNEINNSSYYHWAERSRAFQQTLYNYVKGHSNAAVRAIPVGLFSFYGRQTVAQNQMIALGTCEGMCDFVELHNYTGGRRPTEGGLPLSGGGGDSGSSTAEVQLSQTIAELQAVAPGKPVWAGEVGQNAQSTLDPSLAGNYGITSAIAQSKYISRTPLVYYKYNIQHSSIYAWLNNWTHDFHGCLNNNKPVSQKPVGSTYAEFTGPPFTFAEKMVGTTMMRLLAVMSDPGADFTPGTLAYEFTGAGATGELIHQLWQKRSGKFMLMVHHNGVSWKRTAPVGDLNPTASVTLTLGAPVANMKWWKPHASATATDLGAGQVFNLTVPDYETVLEITP